MNFELDPERLIILQSVVAAFVILLVLERVLPARKSRDGVRTLSNVLLQLLNVLLLFLVPTSLIGASLWALFNQFGVFNQFTLGLWTRIILGLLVLDLLMYWLHRSYHGVGVLWRFHRIHHSDAALDLSTTFRTHPVETLITFGVRALVILSLGLPLIGVILYEVIVAVSALFIHTNLRLWRGFDTVLGTLLITPSRHRLHHDRDPAIRECNYGLVLSVWDRMFGTLKSSDADLSDTELPDAEQARIGLSSPLPGDTIGSLLVTPFRSQ